MECRFANSTESNGLNLFSHIRKIVKQGLVLLPQAFLIPFISEKIEHMSCPEMRLMYRSACAFFFISFELFRSFITSKDIYNIQGKYSIYKFVEFKCCKHKNN